MPLNKKAKLIEGDVAKTILTLSVPMFFATVGIVLFNLIDTFFIGKLGTIHLAALGFTFPVIMVLGSIGMGIGIGASAVISKAIGVGDHKRVQRLTTDSLLLAFILTLIFVTIGFLTISPLFKAMGASDEVLPLIRDYMEIWYIGIVFLIIPMVGNNAIRASGDTTTPALIMAVAIIINIILDPVLIFGLGPIPAMELKGAAIATVISRAVTLLFSLYILYYRDRMITFHAPPLSEIVESWRSILHIGIPATFTKLIVPVSFGIITEILAGFGPEAVAAFGVAIKIEFFALTVFLAISSVIGPFVGQNLGAEKFDRVCEGLKFSHIFSMAWGVFIFIVFFLASESIASIFVNDKNVLPIIIKYLLIVPIGYGLQGVFIVSTTVLNVLNKPFHSVGLAIVQMLGICIPLSYIGSYFFGTSGIFGAILVAFAGSGIIAYRILMNSICQINPACYVTKKCRI